MKYTLVKPDGSLGHSHNFESTPPTLAPNKGKWLPDVIPAFDPVIQIVTIKTQQPAEVTTIQYDITSKPAGVIAAEAKRAQEEAEKTSLRTLPAIKQLRRKTKAEVIDLVQAAFPPGPQRDLARVLALVAWVSVLDRDPTDEGA